ncbi:uncharacterized protein LOC121432041 [Lytechinus variegatus]|uniref:uncharacterized protein LOC121432041 n=1 Tax=Lytechinus variegatus TaxID=7654 RepID=UPI001BB16C54|nr:uncharacterized protein LOC121432041 [Lytechinus variegatus]
MSSARVILWCAPRCTSNLFAKCVTAIPGNEVWIEPYQQSQFAHNEMLRLGLIDKDGPWPYTYEGNEELFDKAAVGIEGFLGSQSVKVNRQRLPYSAVKSSLEQSTSQHVFVKDFGLAVHSETLRQYLPAGFKHTFLIRHPYLVFRSFRKALCAQMLAIGRLKEEDVDDFDIEFLGGGPSRRVDEYVTKNHELWQYVRENIDPNPVVIDSTDLLENPGPMLSKYCHAAGLPYSDSLLTWEATVESYQSWKLVGENIMDNAENFVGALLNTTGFLPPSPIPSRDELTSDVLKASDSSMACYQEMYASRIT